jgi:hypothetical protein
MEGERFTKLEIDSEEEIVYKKVVYTEVSIERVFNLGNYETVRIKVKAQVDDYSVQETLQKVQDEITFYFQNRFNNTVSNFVEKTKPKDTAYEI